MREELMAVHGDQNGEQAKGRDLRIGHSIPPLRKVTFKVKIVGDSPLICHRWSEKAKKMMLDAQMQKVSKGKRPPKNPEEEYRASLYPYPDGGFGFPAAAFKIAAVDACRFVDGLPMTEARGLFHVIGELVKIEGDEPRMREDMVRLESGVADLRYRGEFANWWTELSIRYNAAATQPEHILNLLNVAGFAVGVGENRPMSKKSKGGSYGMFHVAIGDE
jgi:hypothetical protein